VPPAALPLGGGLKPKRMTAQRAAGVAPSSPLFNRQRAAAAQPLVSLGNENRPSPAWRLSFPANS
jgi:hypothetical protein